MRIVLGNVNAKEPYTEEVATRDRKELTRLARERGVAADNPDGTPKDNDRLAREIGAVHLYRRLPGRRETEIGVPNGVPMPEAFVTVTARTGVWAAWSDGAPAWVECDNAAFAELLAAHWGCPIGRPDDWSISFEDDDEEGKP